jgi:hypothetical protein
MKGETDRHGDTHFHFTFHLPELGANIERKLDLILRKENTIMGKLDELAAELVVANEQTNAIATAVAESATDIDDLLAKVAAGGLDPVELAAVLDQARANTTALRAQAQAAQAVAAKHTP